MIFKKPYFSHHLSPLNTMLLGRHFTYIWDIFSEQYNFLVDSRGSMIIHFLYLELMHNAEKGRQFD
jgi:hypothetical protein